MDSDQSLPQNYQPQPPTGYVPAPQFNFKSEDPFPDKPQDGYGYTPISGPQKQTNNSAIVVSSQPTPTIATTIRHDVGNHYLTLSVTVTVLCFITGSWSALLCTIPAIIFSAIMARDAEVRGDLNSAQVNSNLSLGCSIGGLIIGPIVTVIVIIIIITQNIIFNDLF